MVWGETWIYTTKRDSFSWSEKEHNGVRVRKSEATNGLVMGTSVIAGLGLLYSETWWEWQ